MRSQGDKVFDVIRRHGPLGFALRFGSVWALLFAFSFSALMSWVDVHVSFAELFYPALPVALAGGLAGGLLLGYRARRQYRAGLEARFPCPCCGYRTLVSPRSWHICEICYWEDDPYQFEDPELEEGANVPSLIGAQKNFGSFGAAEPRVAKFTRKPKVFDVRDPTWKPHT